jgi:alpha/beta superfamily hydrolase
MTPLLRKSAGGQEVSFRSKGETLTATFYNNSPVGVVLCPPHPLYGGSRHDTRIVRVARELALHNISALCMEYGSYGKGVGEVQNVLDAISYLQKRVRSLGLLGYSFGAVVVSNAAARAEIKGFVAMSILKKINGLEANLDSNCPKLFVHGKRDNVAPYSEFEHLYAEAKGRKEKLVLDTGHFYMEDYPAALDLASKTIREFFGKVFFE